MSSGWEFIESDILELILVNIPVTCYNYMSIQRVCKHWSECSKAIGLVEHSFKKWPSPSQQALLRNSRCLRALRFETDKIVDAHASPLAEMLLSFPKLEELSLLHTVISDEHISDFANALAHCPLLRKFEFSSKSLTSSGLEKVSEALKRCQSLSHLYIEGPHFDDDAGVTLSGLVQSNTHLSYVGINGEDMGDKGVVELVAAVVASPSVRRFHSWQSRISDKALGEISLSLRAPSSLREFGLSGVGEEHGCVLLVDAIREGNTLRSVLINHVVGSAGFFAVGQMLQKMTSLVELVIVVNAIEGEGFSAMVRGLALSSSLRKFVLVGDVLSRSQIRTLSDAILENRTLVSVTCKLFDWYPPSPSSGAVDPRIQFEPLW
eukprot:Rmarinus@m.15141